MEKEAEQIINKKDLVKEAQKELLNDMYLFAQNIENEEHTKINSIMLEEEKNIFIDMIKNLFNIIKPIEVIAPTLYIKLKNILHETMKKIEVREQMRVSLMKNSNNQER